MSLDDVKRRILAKADLATLIGEKTALSQRSGQMTGCCPFHPEKTPSFYVYQDHYHCYGCKAHGDAITFVRETEGMGFVEALRWLAQRTGVEVPELDEARGRMGARRQDASLFKMMAEAQAFFVEQLATPHGEAALSYLQKRGFTAASIAAYGFGTTPPEGFGLVRYLRGKGFSERDMLDCSLATGSARDGRAYDFLRARVTLPIRDGQGRIVAFGGRTLDGSQPKYLNSRESKLFDKSHTLFGFDQARKVMRERGRAIVTEGYMDTLMLWQEGFPETVACLGTAFTEHHLKQLRHATGACVLLFDGDRAGQQATLAAVSVALLVPEVQVRAVALSGGEDPDSFVRAHGAATLERRLSQGVDLLDYAVREKLKATHALAVPDLVHKEFVPWLAKVSDRLQRSFLVARISQLTGIPAGNLESQLRSLMPSLPGRPAVSVAAKTRPVELDPLAMEVFGHVFHAQPGELEPTEVRDLVARILELGPEHEALLDEFLAALAKGESPASQPTGRWTEALDPEVQKLIDRLQLAAKAFSCSDRRSRLKRIHEEAQRRSIKAQVHRLKAEMLKIAADPARASEMSQILKSIGDLTRGMG